MLTASSDLAAVWMLSALLLGGCSPTNHSRQATCPRAHPEDEVAPVCPAVYSADTWRANRAPFSWGSCQSCTPSEVLSSSFDNTRAVQMEMPEARKASSKPSVVSNWVRRSLCARSDSITCQFLTLHFVF